MQFPSKYLKAQRCTITNRTLTELTEYGFKKTVAKRGNPQRWAIDMTVPPMGEQNIRGMIAFLDTLDGRYTSFTIASPIKWLSKASGGAVNSATNAGVNTVSIKGLTANLTDPFAPGDFIKFSGHSKCYKIISCTDANASGVATMVIYPRLFSNLTVDETFAEAVFTCRLKADDLSLPLDATRGLMALLIAMEEDV